jgi:LruC domain-containing protein
MKMLKKLPQMGWASLNLALIFILSSCQKQTEHVIPKSAKNPEISKYFNFNTTNEVKINITAKDASGSTIRMSNIQIFDKEPSEGGKLLVQGGIDKQGKFTAFKAIPTYINEVVVLSNYLGVLDKITVPIINGSITCNFVPVNRNSGAKIAANEGINGGKYTYLGDFNSFGVPAYLVMPNDIVDADFLNAINNSLPETKKINPAYLAPGLSRDIPVIKDAFLTITFVSEAARNKNALGYYTYPLSNPPTSVSDIKDKMIVFPNSSFSGSGGGLASGNKVKLPTKISAGTGVGFFIAVNGWNGSGVSEKVDLLFSNPALNSGRPEQQQHSILLNYNSKYILGFEDMRRDGPYSDEDFNDVVFYITADVPDAVDDTEIPPTDQENDCDKDGTPDKDDAYPCDATKAFENTSVGTLAFEDLWPNKGDFDMNDLVVNYTHKVVTNSQNKVVELNSTFDLIAMGARFNNGFGFELSKLSPSQITSVTSTHNKTLLEEGHNKATILVFDNAFDFIPQGQDAMINTYMALPKVTCGSITVTTKFVAGLTMEDLGAAPFNPFLVSNKNRGVEVHLPGYLPTSKADVTLFGTKDDITKPAEGIYYKTKEGMPFALHLPVGQFTYPIEMASITDAHLKFTPWATSNGTVFTDWYLNLPDYRDATKIYTK